MKGREKGGTRARLRGGWGKRRTGRKRGKGGRGSRRREE